MGSIAGANLSMISMVSMEHDLESKIRQLQDQQMLLSQRSIFLAEEKSQIYGNYSEAVSSDKSAEATMNQKLQEISAKERKIEMMEKSLEMLMTNLKTQLEQVQQRKKAEQERLQKNIQGAFSYGLGGGR